MVVQEQQQRVLAPCQPCDAVPESQKVRKNTVPESWKLTQQQQAFIDLFAEDESRKQ
ncbi:hypothetical protein [Citrobacter sp. RHB25-C09]|uniref:hypothetical protein n=1 Tax=Citrobacter TaxID=544 RepID=UPI0015EF73F8|nr:hypothetical protein [Citrobacter sp. RHB25-C09]QMI05314.1 hypothetical protein HVY19_10750 [Citrobacter sp. RHB25-C09]